ncbi:MAG: hypothetical protein ACI4Q6_09165 [Huintestinicola sp.]
MNFKKIVTSIAAAAVATAVCAVSVSAASVNAVLGFADMGWCHQDWESSVEVTGDGQYTIESTLVAGAEDFGVFVVDLQGMYAEYPDAVATLDEVCVDGSPISFTASKIMYGDIEEKGNFRIDIYNQYSDTKNDPGVNQATPVAESISVTFTVTGLGGASEEASADVEVMPISVEETPASDTTTTPAATGNTSAAAVAAVMAVAGAAALVSKRK